MGTGGGGGVEGGEACYCKTLLAQKLHFTQIENWPPHPQSATEHGCTHCVTKAFDGMCFN